MNPHNRPFRSVYWGPLNMEDLAIDCKILSIIFWTLVATLKILLDLATLDSPDRPREVPARDWENPAYYYRICVEILVLLVIALLAVVPNRWFVSSRKIFGAAIVIALIPPCVVSIQNCRDEPFMALVDYLAALASAALIFIFFAPLPTSITLSFWRKQRGEKVGFA